MLRITIFTFIVLSIASCSSNKTIDAGSIKSFSEYRSCQLDLPIYLNSGEGVGQSEQQAHTLALSVLAQSVEVDVETKTNSEISKSTSKTNSSFSEKVGLNSKVTLSGYQVECKTKYQGKHYLTLSYDNRTLDVKLINALNDLYITSLNNLNGPKLLLESPVFSDAFGCDSNPCAGPYNGDVNVRLAEKDGRWFLNVGQKQIRVATGDLYRLVSTNEHSYLRLSNTTGESYLNNRLKNGDLFKLSYEKTLGGRSHLNVYVLAEDGTLTSLIENMPLSTNIKQFEPLQTCMKKNEYNDCLDIPNTISVDRFLAVETIEVMPSFFIDKMNFEFSKEKAVNTNKLPSLVGYLSKAGRGSTVSLLEVITTPINE